MGRTRLLLARPNLQSAVREVHERNDGETYRKRKKKFKSIKGVGPYTSGAILSIAYNQPEPAVDGNVMRVLSRYFLIEEDITKPCYPGENGVASQRTDLGGNSE